MEADNELVVVRSGVVATDGVVEIKLKWADGGLRLDSGMKCYLG